MRPQIVVVPVALLLMLLATVVGVIRLMALQDLTTNPPLSSLFPFHGEMMIFGFLAVLIVTERYIGSLTFPLNRSIHLMPFLVAVGALLKVLGRVAEQGNLNTAGSIILALGLLLYLYMLDGVSRRSARPLPFYYMMLGGVLLLLGSLFSISALPSGDMNFSLFLLGFPLLTIIGERVELSRFLSATAYRYAQWAYWGVAVAFVLLLIQDGSGWVALWAVLLALTALPLLSGEWTLWRTAERPMHRYLGRHLLIAYGWLFLGLAAVIAWALNYTNLSLFDAATHSLAVGFVGTMILAHAPLIVPALLHRTVAEERLHWLPLVLLTIGNLLRVGGDILKAADLPLEAVIGISGLFILASLLAFAYMIVRSLRPA